MLPETLSLGMDGMEATHQVTDASEWEPTEGADGSVVLGKDASNDRLEL